MYNHSRCAIWIERKIFALLNIIKLYHFLFLMVSLFNGIYDNIIYLTLFCFCIYDVSFLLHNLINLIYGII